MCQFFFLKRKVNQSLSPARQPKALSKNQSAFTLPKGQFTSRNLSPPKRLNRSPDTTTRSKQKSSGTATASGQKSPLIFRVDSSHVNKDDTPLRSTEQPTSIQEQMTFRPTLLNSSSQSQDDSGAETMKVPSSVQQKYLSLKSSLKRKVYLNKTKSTQKISLTLSNIQQGAQIPHS